MHAHIRRSLISPVRPQQLCYPLLITSALLPYLPMRSSQPHLIVAASAPPPAQHTIRYNSLAFERAQDLTDWFCTHWRLT